MLSLLNTVAAPAAANTQPPGLGARADGTADIGGEFAKALERSNSSWQNAAADQASAPKPATAMQRRPDAQAPVAPDHRQSSRPESAGGARSEQAGSTSSAAEEGAEQSAVHDPSNGTAQAADEALPANARGTRGNQRRTSTEARQAAAAQGPRGDTRRADVDNAGEGSKPTSSADDAAPVALDEDISRAAGLLPAPQAAAETPPASMPILITPSAWMPSAEAQVDTLPTDAASSTEADSSALLADSGLQPSGRATTGGISTTSLAGPMRRQPLIDGLSQARAASPGTESTAANTAADNDPRSTAALARSMSPTNPTERDSIATRLPATDAGSDNKSLRPGIADKRNTRPLAVDAPTDTDKATPAATSAATVSTVVPSPDAAQTGAAAQAALADASRPVALNSSSSNGGTPAGEAAVIGADRRTSASALAASATTAPAVSAAAGPAVAEDGKTALPATEFDASRAATTPLSDARAPLPAQAAARPADDSRGTADTRTSRVTAANGSTDVASTALGPTGEARTKPAAPASARATDGRSSDNRGTRNTDSNGDASAQAALAAPINPGSQARDNSESRSDGQRDNAAALSANANNLGASATSSGNTPRFADQLQSFLPAGAIAAAAQPQAAAIASQPNAPVLTTQLATSLYSPDFAPAMGAQVTLFARNGVHQARIELNPAEMGPISVQIEMKGSGARVDFQAEQAGTRQVIESSLPALASALRDAGMTLTGGGVFQPDVTQAAPQNSAGFNANNGGMDNGQAGGQSGSQGSNQAGNHAGGQRGNGRGAGADDGSNFGTTSTVRLANAQRGLVDLIA